MTIRTDSLVAMMGEEKRRHGWLALAVLVAGGCAQVGSPGGGGQDEAAPVVVSAAPAFGTTDWTGSRLELTFDEFVQLQDARNQVLVSPPLPASPRVLVKGRSVLVELGGELAPDRTYVVQFGRAIRDLRESNVAAGLQHVFATGSRLDSGRVSARVLDAWTGEPTPGARLMLYRDSLPNGILDATLPDSMRPLPDYVGMVGDSGRVEIEYLPKGAYAMVALNDINGNYRVDVAEPVAWWAKAIPTLDSLAVEPVLRLDAPPLQPATYLSGMGVDSSGYWRAKLEGWTDLKAGPDGWSEAELSVSIIGPEDTVEVHVEADSLWAELPNFRPGDPPGTWRLVHPAGVDSLHFREVEAVGAPAVVGRPESKINAGGDWLVRWAPLPDALDTALCVGTVVMDQDTMPLERALLTLEGNRLRCASASPGSRCQLTLLPGAVGRGGQTQADTLAFQWTMRTDTDVGALVLIGDSLLAKSVKEWVLVLTKENGDPLYDQPLNGEGRFVDLEPGRYGLVALDDVDGDGRWTGVDPSTMRHPEGAVVVSTDIEVRAGWEVELVLPVLPRP